MFTNTCAEAYFRHLHKTDNTVLIQKVFQFGLNQPYSLQLINSLKEDCSTVFAANTAKFYAINLAKVFTFLTIRAKNNPAYGSEKWEDVSIWTILYTTPSSVVVEYSRILTVLQGQQAKASTKRAFLDAFIFLMELYNNIMGGKINSFTADGEKIPCPSYDLEGVYEERNGVDLAITQDSLGKDMSVLSINDIKERADNAFAYGSFAHCLLGLYCEAPLRDDAQLFVYCGKNEDFVQYIKDKAPLINYIVFDKDSSPDFTSYIYIFKSKTIGKRADGSFKHHNPVIITLSGELTRELDYYNEKTCAESKIVYPGHLQQFLFGDRQLSHCLIRHMDTIGIRGGIGYFRRVHNATARETGDMNERAKIAKQSAHTNMTSFKYTSHIIRDAK